MLYAAELVNFFFKRTWNGEGATKKETEHLVSNHLCLSYPFVALKYFFEFLQPIWHFLAVLMFYCYGYMAEDTMTIVTHIRESF